MVRLRGAKNEDFLLIIYVFTHVQNYVIIGFWPGKALL